MPVQNGPPCRLRTRAGSGPRLGRGAGGLRRARPRQCGRAPSAVPPPPFGRQPQPDLVWTVPPPSTGAPAATDLLLRQPSASASSAREYACGAAASLSSHEAHGRRNAALRLQRKAKGAAPVEEVRGNGERALARRAGTGLPSLRSGRRTPQVRVEFILDSREIRGSGLGSAPETGRLLVTAAAPLGEARSPALGPRQCSRQTTRARPSLLAR